MQRKHHRERAYDAARKWMTCDAKALRNKQRHWSTSHHGRGQPPQPLSHEDSNRGEDARLEDQNIQGAAVLEEADLVALRHRQRPLVVRGSLDTDPRRAIVRWTDGRVHRADLGQANRNLGDKAMPAGVVDVVGALEILERGEVRVAATRVATVEPRRPVANAEVETLDEPALHEASGHWSMEAVVVVRHQDA